MEILNFSFNSLTEILRLSGMIPNQVLSDYDRLQRGSPSPVGSIDMMQHVGGKGLGGWNGNGWNAFQEVSLCLSHL